MKRVDQIYYITFVEVGISLLLKAITNGFDVNSIDKTRTLHCIISVQIILLGHLVGIQKLQCTRHINF